MNSGSVCLDVHGIEVEVSGISGNSRFLEEIAEDFSFFRVPTCVAPELRIILGQSPDTLQKKLEALAPAFRTRMCRAHGWRGTRICDYGEGVLVSVNRNGPETAIEISKGRGSGSSELVYEALYSVLLSALGEQLDRRGFHRVHALGLSGSNGKTALVLLPSGGGKSAIAALLMSRGDFRIFSDESPLLRDGKIHPFPVRGALRPEVAEALGIGGRDARRFKRKLFAEKILFPFDGGCVAEAAPATWILVGRRAGKANGISLDPSAHLVVLARLLDTAVMGRGLAQMREYMIRSDSVWNLPKIAWSRLQSVRALLEGAKVGWFDVSDDARQNSKALAHFLSVE